MRKIFKLLFSWSILFHQFNTLSAQAFNESLDKTAKGGGFNTNSATTGNSQDLLIQKIATVLNMLLSLLGIIFLILIIYSGYKWMMARDNSSEVDKAKSSIANSVIGLILVLSAYAITLFIKSGFTDLIGV